MRKVMCAGLASLAVAAAGCDAVYMARIDVGPYEGQSGKASPLSPEQRDRCVEAFAGLARELGLECREGSYPILADSYDPNVYRLTACGKSGDFTRIHLAVGQDRLSVELHKIAGFREPSFFRECRVGFSERLRERCGNDQVTVRYPYRRAREE